MPSYASYGEISYVLFIYQVQNPSYRPTLGYKKSGNSRNLALVMGENNNLKDLK